MLTLLGKQQFVGKNPDTGGHKDKKTLFSARQSFLEFFNLSDAATEHEETVYSYANQSLLSLSWLI